MAQGFKKSAGKPFRPKKDVPSKHGKAGIVTKKGRVFVAPKRAIVKAALEENQEFTRLINSKNEMTAAAQASNQGGRLNVIKAAEGLELTKKGKLIEAAKNLPAKKTAK